MSQDNSAFGHHLDQISGTQLETQVPPDTKDNNFLIEMSSFEKIKARRGCGHLTIITVRQSVSSFAPEPELCQLVVQRVDARAARMELF